MITIGQLIRILGMIDARDHKQPITVLLDGTEMPFRNDGPVVTKEGGGAGLVYYAINVTEA